MRRRAHACRAARRLLVLALFGGCAALAGCGVAAAPMSTGTARSAVARAQATHEYPSPPPPPERVATGSDAPLQAIVQFAGAYINWTARTVASDMRTLAAHSIGQARSAMELAAAQTTGDYELQEGGISNRGQVEAVAPLLGQQDRFVVVTRELTTATATTAYQGLQPAWHLTIATVARTPSGQWVLSGWQPES